MVRPRLRVLAAVVVLSCGACVFDGTGLGETATGASASTAASGPATTTGGDTDDTSAAGSTSGGESESASSGALTTGVTATTTDATTTTGDLTATTEEPTATSEATSSTSEATSSTSDGTDTDPDTTGCGDPQTYYLDADMDGFGDPSQSVVACAPPAGYVGDMSDCNDGAITVHPGAPEICDNLDNDCNNLVDEYAATNPGKCGACDVLVTADRVYHFCDDSSGWNVAGTRCGKLGAGLLVIDATPEYDLVWTRLKTRSYEHWIGASDKENEGTVRWVDGGTLADNDPHWAPGQPPGGLLALTLDCVAIGAGNASSDPGRYRMADCGLISRPRICERVL